MSKERETVLAGLANAVVDMDIEAVEMYANKALALGIKAEDAIMDGLAKGMEKVSELFREDIYYVPEVVVCGDTMYAGLEILKAAIEKNKKPAGKIVIGVVAGDTHNIGKNIVSIMLEGAGFEIYDLGSDVPLHAFVDKALEVDADIIALSALISTTRDGMRVVIDDLKKRGMQRKRFVIVGGAVISPAFAKRIGADGYSADACEAVVLVKNLMEYFQRGGNN
jgi:methylmalonyl-CoA mutase cobalamin-binding domain/chain